MASQKSFYYRAERIHGPCVLYAIPSHPVEERCSLALHSRWGFAYRPARVTRKKRCLDRFRVCQYSSGDPNRDPICQENRLFRFRYYRFATSFIAKEADICLYAKRGLHTKVNTLVPAFSLVNALAIALGQAKTSDSIKALKDLDDLYETYLK